MIFDEGQKGNKQLLKQIYTSIEEQAVFIEEHLQRRPFPNNHLIGEAAALVFVGVVFPEFNDASRWRKKGLEILEEQISLQVFSDGMDKEQAFDYHRFVVDFFSQAVILCTKQGIAVSDNFLRQLEKMYDVLLYTCAPDGRGPMFGDDDNARAALLSGDEGGNFLSALSTGAVLFKRADMKYVAGGFHKESLWLLGPAGAHAYAQLSPKEPGRCSCRFSDAGFCVMRSGWQKDALVLVFDAGDQGMGQAGHGHADALSFEIHAYGKKLITDAGTFRYNGLKKWRDYFRGTAAHNTVLVDNQDQAEHVSPFDAFGWARKVQARVLEWFNGNEFDYVSAEHDGYGRLRNPVVHQRNIIFVKPEYWIIADFLYGQGTHEMRTLFHLTPGTCFLNHNSKVFKTTHHNAANIVVVPANTQSLKAAVIEGRPRPIQGWVSPRYGVKVKSPVLEYTKRMSAEGSLVTILYPLAAGEEKEVHVENIPVHCQRPEQKKPQAECVRIETGASEDYCCVCRQRGEIKSFHSFSTNAQVAYLRKNKDNHIERVLLLNGAFLFEEDVAVVAIERDIQSFELRIEETQVHIHMSERVAFRLGVSGVTALTINGKKAQFENNAAYNCIMVSP